MDLEVFVYIIGFLFAVTVVYKILPYREAKGEKPKFTVFPKYRKVIRHNLEDKEIEELLKNHGFELRGGAAQTALYTRGSILGDFLIRFSKIKLLLTYIKPGELELFLSASLVVVFDTGDHFQLIIELSNEFSST